MMVHLRLPYPRVVLIVVMLVGIAASMMPISIADAQKLSPQEAANRMFILVNEWRMSEDAPPLIINPILQRMAEAQAQDLIPRFDKIDPSNYKGYHEDVQGRNQFKRAFEVFNWPNYSLPERIEVGENVAQFSINQALGFWKQSDIHHRTAVNKSYREAGITALAYPSGGYLFVMTFGARPSVIPALLNPAGNQLFLTRENSKYAKDGKTEPKVRLYDEARNPLTEESAWKATLDIPANAGGRFYVVYKYNKSEVWSLVDRTRDIAIIPNSPMTVADQLAKMLADVKPVMSNSGTRNPAPTAAPIIASTASVAALSSVTPPAAPIATSSPETDVPVATRVQLSPTPTRIIVVPATGAKADLRIYYGERGLFVHNVAGKPINIKNMTVGRLKADNWLSIAPFQADKFSADNCLQVGVTGAGDMAVPTGCKSVRAVITVGATRAFWTQGPFVITIDAKQVQECAPTANQCDVILP